MEFTHGPGIDEPLALTRDGQTYTYQTDSLGSIVAITDANGQVVQRYVYDAYGNLTYTQNTDFQQPYGFTGRERDAESKLYYYRARYYDPQLGRFISKDPIGFAGGDVNLYGYVVNDPVNWIDPNGLSSSLLPSHLWDAMQQEAKPFQNPENYKKAAIDIAKIYGTAALFAVPVTRFYGAAQICRAGFSRLPAGVQSRHLANPGAINEFVSGALVEGPTATTAGAAGWFGGKAAQKAFNE